MFEKIGLAMAYSFVALLSLSIILVPLWILVSIIKWI